MTNSQRIIIRADGSSQIGLGHVIRCLALAQMLQDKFKVFFAIQQPDASLQEQIKAVGATLINLPSENNLLHEARFLTEHVLRSTDVVVLDGYHFETNYQKTLKSKNCALLCIDDTCAFPYVADVVLNQAGGILANVYNTASYTRLLLGPNFALLRPPFLVASKESRPFPVPQLHVLLNFGGADPQNFTLQVAKRLYKVPGIGHLHLVVGSAYLFRPELEEWLQDKSQVELHHNLSADAMCKIMKLCAIAVTSASGIAYEYAAVGGLLFIKQTAGNQKGLYNYLINSGLASDINMLPQIISEAWLMTSFETKVALQRQTFDGRSGDRILQVMETLAMISQVTLRNVMEEDMLVIFDWSNDPEVRRRSFNSKPIPLEGHKTWFNLKLKQKDAYLYIAEVNGVAAAHIRFEVAETIGVVSYMISREFRGKGLGHSVLLKGIKKLLEQRPTITNIEGLVQKDNQASVRAFEKAGFEYAAPDPKYPHAHRFVLQTKQTFNS
ncbi:UDP-2,4-diacetamido-2,4,6-trideoxy-beta-L-altropyranose hydrolase [Pontibacter sp. 13R65]|uniref:UDP-2,4-diacetamido-2,4, 6-trideoxy-beta-L-altropyranose hydrolase n=1 Tax=Pontibacter sp. 13R65 TaxID=3127458 RepID=UPI00301D3A0D